MDHDVNTLISAADEVHWEEEGLFASLDEFKAINTKIRHPEKCYEGDVIMGEPLFTTQSDSGHKRSSTFQQDSLLDLVASILDPSLASCSTVQARVTGGHVLGTDNKYFSVQRNVEDKDGRKNHREKPYSHSVKFWKLKKTKCKLVLGMDIGLEESCTLSLCALMGIIAYRSRCTTVLEEWMKIN
jgi:hypothetical protein